MKEENIMDYVIEHKSSMIKKQQQLSDFILKHHQDIGLMTVGELAAEAGVGKTTVLRFVQELGFDSFFELKKEFYEIQKDYSDKWENIQLSFQKDEDENSTKTLYEVWKEAIQVLDDTLTPQLVESFERAIDLIDKASSINLLGLRPYRPVAMYAEVLISEFDSKVRQLSNDSETILDKVLLLSQSDVIIIFELSPHSTRIIDAAEVAKKRGMPIILITDKLSSPIGEFSDVLLKIESSNRYFTIVSLIALIEAMVIELGQRRAPDSVKNLRTLSNMLKEKGYVIE